MSIIDITPLLSLIIGVLLIVFILSKRSGLGNDKKIRIVLASIVFLYTFTAFDYYITINNNGNTTYFGASYLFIHLLGFLLYYFIALFTNTTINLKRGALVAISYTILRWSFFFPFMKYNSLQEFVRFVKESRYDMWLEWEYIFMNLINVVLFTFAFFRLRTSPFAMDLNQNQSLKHKWIKLILIAFVLLQLGILISDVVSNFKIDNYESYEANMKFESLLISIFFFLFTFSIMQFPVFAFTGNFEDLPKSVKKKYAKSALTDSSELFNEINELVKNEKLYLDFNLKLNSLSERLGKSVHHVSQAINQNAQMNFPDFINTFRIEMAKKRLLEPNPDTIFAIYLDVGFNSKAAFYSAFKKNTSLTPTEFKNANKKITSA
ncbi:helix-turn-helix domain-containing protein [uncultured Maribacter sp.]|uniref:helix-turn-helix domain-containing protein n=1 Tax=uncultured Maribacter sp. TaxID=431308 RepID=UPI0026278B21|nr:helix-turn-helix domain-containing protein [uncultured Maribacter sp.]